MDHEKLTAAATAILADQTKPRDQRYYEAACLLARGLGEGLVRPGWTLTLLETGKGADGVDRTYNHLHVWGLNDQGPNKDYLGVFASSGAVLMFRILKYAVPDRPLAWDDEKKVWEGGNDYVLIHRHQSPVVF